MKKEDNTCKCTFKLKAEYSGFVNIGGKAVNMLKANLNDFYSIAPWLFERKLCMSCKTSGSFETIIDIEKRIK